MNIKNRIANFFQSGFKFSEDEYELKLYHLLYNAILSIVVLMLSILSIVRYTGGNEMLAMTELIFIVFSITSMISIRENKHHITKVTPVILSLFFVLVSFSFYTVNHYIGASWYMVLILPAFFLGGITAGMITTIASILSIIFIKTIGENQNSIFSFFYILMPLIITAVFVLLYELRNNKARQLLKEKNRYLEHKVELKTQEIKELADMVDKSNIELYIVDMQTDHYMYVNQGGLNALGYTLQEMLQMSVYDTNPALTVEMVTKMKELSKTTPNIMNIAQHERKDGSSYGVQSFIHPITYHGKDAYVIYDINLSDQQKAHEEVLRQKEALLTHAHYDTLTKLPNRILFHDRLSQAIAKSKRSKKELALLFIDLDHFKEINDSLGHDIGDKVLIEVASRFKNSLRAEDTISRLGGDEFTVIIENLESRASASMLAQKLIDNIQRPIVVEQHNLFVTCSIGISIYPENANEDKSLINTADDAMYKAKEDGKNRFKFFAA